MVAGRQFYKCANKPGSKLVGLDNYKCPLWKSTDMDTKGCFDESSYEIDHITEFFITHDDDPKNLQALCKMCHAVKTKLFLMQKYRKIKCEIEKNKEDSEENNEQYNYYEDYTNVIPLKTQKINTKPYKMYTCNKCKEEFERKSIYNCHLKRKTPCILDKKYPK